MSSLSSFNNKSSTPQPTHPLHSPELGIISYLLPSPLHPYAELARIHYLVAIPLGSYPTILGILYALAIAAPSSSSSSSLADELTWDVIANLLTATFFLRSAGCAWNDIIDQDYDRQTSRCRNRPVARGAVSTRNGTVYTGLLFYLAYYFISGFSGVGTRWSAAAMAFFVIVYPFGKRFTHFPQLLVGVCFGFGFLCATYAVLEAKMGTREGVEVITTVVGMDPLGPQYRVATAGVFGAIVCLFVFFDVVYARQDTDDDLRSGVKSMAVLFRRWIPELLGVVTVMAGGCLSVTGYVLGLGWVYYVLAVGGVVACLAMKIILLEMEGEISSGWCFPLGILGLMGGLYYCIVRGE